MTVAYSSLEQWGFTVLHWTITENRELSSCQLCCHWRHRRMSSRHSAVPPLMTKVAIITALVYQWLLIHWRCCNLALSHRTVISFHSKIKTWWRHQMESFSVLLALCAGNSPVTGEFPAQRPVTRSFDVFFDLCLNKRLSKQWRGWWFETPSCPLWRYCNETTLIKIRELKGIPEGMMA